MRNKILLVLVLVLVTGLSGTAVNRYDNYVAEQRAKGLAAQAEIQKEIEVKASREKVIQDCRRELVQYANLTAVVRAKTPAPTCQTSVQVIY